VSEGNGGRGILPAVRLIFQKARRNLWKSKSGKKSGSRFIERTTKRVGKGNLDSHSILPGASMKGREKKLHRSRKGIKSQAQ